MYFRNNVISVSVRPNREDYLHLIYFTRIEAQVIQIYIKELSVASDQPLKVFLWPYCVKKVENPVKTHMSDLVTSFHLTCRRR